MVDSAMKREQQVTVEYEHSNNNQVFFLDIPTHQADRYPTIDDYIEDIRWHMKQCDILLFVYRNPASHSAQEIYSRIAGLKELGSVFIVEMKYGDHTDEKNEEDEVNHSSPNGVVSHHTEESFSNSYSVTNYRGNIDEDHLSCDDYGYQQLLSDMTLSINPRRRHILKCTYNSPIKRKYDLLKQRLSKEWRVGAVALLPTLAGGLGSLPIPGAPMFLNLCILFEAVLCMGRPLGLFGMDSRIWSRFECVNYLRKSGGLKFCFISMVIGEVVRHFYVRLGPAFSGLLFSFTTWGLLTGLQDQFLEYGRLKMEEQDEFRLF